MDELKEIKEYLLTYKFQFDDKKFYNKINKLKRKASFNFDENLLNEIWCLEKIYQIQKKYVEMYNNLKKQNYYKAWLLLDEIDTDLILLKPNLSFEKNIYNLCFIEKIILKYEILFRSIYRVFFSRELLVKSYRCSICDRKISLRNNCEHKKGYLYWGKLCSHIAEDFEFFGIALVEKSVDRYTVPQENEDIKYDYTILRNLMSKLISPYVFWDVKVLEKKNYKHYNVTIKYNIG